MWRGLFDHALFIKTWWDLCTCLYIGLFLSSLQCIFSTVFVHTEFKMALLKHVVSWLNKLVILVFIVLFITSGLVLNVLQIFLLPLYWINRYAYRILNAKIVYFHWARESALYLHKNIQIGMIPIYTFMSALNKIIICTHNHELCVHLSAGSLIYAVYCRYDTV